MPWFLSSCYCCAQLRRLCDDPFTSNCEQLAMSDPSDQMSLSGVEALLGKDDPENEPATGNTSAEPKITITQFLEQGKPVNILDQGSDVVCRKDSDREGKVYRHNPN